MNWTPLDKTVQSLESTSFYLSSRQSKRISQVKLTDKLPSNFHLEEKILIVFPRNSHGLSKNMEERATGNSPPALTQPLRVLVIPTAPQQSLFLLLLSTQPLPFLLGLDSQLARPWWSPTVVTKGITVSVLLIFPLWGRRCWVVRFDEKGTFLLYGSHGCCPECA